MTDKLIDRTYLQECSLYFVETQVWFTLCANPQLHLHISCINVYWYHLVSFIRDRCKKATTKQNRIKDLAFHLGVHSCGFLYCINNHCLLLSLYCNSPKDNIVECMSKRHILWLPVWHVWQACWHSGYSPPNIRHLTTPIHLPRSYADDH